MLRVTIELIYGGVGEPEVLEQVFIANDGSGSPFLGNYKASQSKSFENAVTIKRYPRLVGDVKSLVIKAFDKLLKRDSEQVEGFALKVKEKSKVFYRKDNTYGRIKYRHECMIYIHRAGAENTREFLEKTDGIELEVVEFKKGDSNA